MTRLDGARPALYLLRCKLGSRHCTGGVVASIGKSRQRQAKKWGRKGRGRGARGKQRHPPGRRTQPPSALTGDATREQAEQCGGRTGDEGGWGKGQERRGRSAGSRSPVRLGRQAGATLWVAHVCGAGGKYAGQRRRVRRCEKTRMNSPGGPAQRGRARGTGACVGGRTCTVGRESTGSSGEASWRRRSWVQVWVRKSRK